MSGLASKKAKIARRVVEVLEFFDENHPQATVMDIVRRYDRPQSSTSELLSSLVDLGILYKDAQSRSYRPTPRAALLGGSVQASIVRDGRLTLLLDRLYAQTGLSVALFGMVGVEVQVFNSRIAKKDLNDKIGANLCGGSMENLTDSAAGQLLLSTLSRPRREGIIRRLNAEAAGNHVPYAEMLERIDQFERAGKATGVSGFGAGARISAALLPVYAVDQPMAVGFVYGANQNVDLEALEATLKSAIMQMVESADSTETVTRMAAA